MSRTEFGEPAHSLAHVPEETIAKPTHATTGLGGMAVNAQAEQEAPAAGVTREDIRQLAEQQGIGGRTFVTRIWFGLQRAADNIDRAKKEVAAGYKRPGESLQEQELRNYRASLDLVTLPDTVGDERGNKAIKLLSLYNTLAAVLKDGYPSEASPLRGLGAHSLSFLASFVNERLQPEMPLPLYDDIAAGLEPLPPMHPRALHRESPFLDRMERLGREEPIVTRDALHRFAVETGVQPTQTVHFLRMIADMGRLSIGRPLGRQAGRPHWVNQDVCYVGLHDVTGGLRRSQAWGIHVLRFIELVYDLERRPGLRARVHGFGPLTRKILRNYLETVAPYTPTTEIPEED